MPKKTRRYPTKHKTTTRIGKNNYMAQYMREYRKQQNLLAQMMLKQLHKQGSPLLNQLWFGKRKSRKKRRKQR